MTDETMHVLELMEEAVERAPADSAPADVILSLRGEGLALEFTLYECLQRLGRAHYEQQHARCGEPDWTLYEPHDAPIISPGEILGTAFAVVTGTASELFRVARRAVGA